MTSELEKIVTETLQEVAKRAVKSVLIAEGWSSDTTEEIRKTITKEAERLVREDEEIKNLIRSSLIKAIK